MLELEVICRSVGRRPQAKDWWFVELQGKDQFPHVRLTTQGITLMVKDGEQFKPGRSYRIEISERL